MVFKGRRRGGGGRKGGVGGGETEGGEEDVTLLAPRPKIFTVWSLTENWDTAQESSTSVQEGWTHTYDWQ